MDFQETKKETKSKRKTKTKNKNKSKELGENRKKVIEKQPSVGLV